MTNREFENYLALVGQMLSLRRGERDAIGCELRDHLEMRVADLIEEGVDEDEATRTALEEFGDATVLAGQFQMISKSYQRRRMMRFATFSVIGSFVVAVMLMSLWPQNNRFGSPDGAMAQEEQATTSNKTDSANEAVKSNVKSAITITGQKVSTAALENQKINDFLNMNAWFDYDQTPFSEVIDDLVDKGKINIVLDVSALDDSLTEDQLITFRIKDLRMENALRLMLKPHNATFVPGDGVLKIISIDVASDPEFFVRRIYDVRHLLSKINENEGTQTSAKLAEIQKKIAISIQNYQRIDASVGSGEPKQIEQMIWMLKQEGRLPVTGDGGQDGLPVLNSMLKFEQDNINELKKQLSKAQGSHSGQQLINVIKTTIAPDDWDDTNGDGTCEILAGLLIVQQPQDVQSALENMLNDIAHAISN